MKLRFRIVLYVVYAIGIIGVALIWIAPCAPLLRTVSLVADLRRTDGAPRAFHDTASMFPIGGTGKQLRGSLGDPDYLVAASNLVSAFSLKPIPQATAEYIAGYAILSTDMPFVSFRAFAQYSMWDNLVPRDIRGTYAHSWITETFPPDAEVWIYAEPVRFGSESFKLHGFLYFIRNDEVLARTYINPWVNDAFLGSDEETKSVLP